MQLLATLRRTNVPLEGKLNPYTQLVINSPICSGLLHLLKSAVGIACRLDYVSIVSGRIVITLPSRDYFFSAFSAKLVAK